MIISKFTKRERILILATAIITLAAFTYGFVIEPLAEARSLLNRQIASGNAKLKRNSKLLKREASIKAEYRKYASLIKTMPSDEEEIASMLKAIEAIGRANNIYITNIRPQPVKANIYYKEFSFEVIAESQLAKLVKFMYDLQASGNLLNIKRLTLTPSSSKQNVLRAAMEIVKPASFSL